MPKILINEQDFTSPGTPGSYANFSVLVAGFCNAYNELALGLRTVKEEEQNEDEKAFLKNFKPAVMPDANGVFEFSNQQAFIDTIGLRAPKLTNNKADPNLYHYGNQMAYELLNMGYTVIYKPITSVSELKNSNTWKVFRDKASYDFRFVTHGLLKSNVEKNSLYVRYEKRYPLVDFAKNELDKIANKYPIEDTWSDEDEKKEAAKEARQAAYGVLLDTAALAKDKNPEDDTYDALYNELNKSFYANFTEAYDIVNEDHKEIEDYFEENSDLYISTGIINDANGCIADLAKYVASENDMYNVEIPGRGDCIALIELDENKYTTTTTTTAEQQIIEAINEMSQVSGDADKGKFCALTVPSVVYKMSYGKDENGKTLFDDNKRFPGAFHYLACFMNSLKTGFREWYAAAGYTRGVSGYTIDYTTVKLGEIAINALEARQAYTGGPKFACNVIANFRGSYFLWGNRTAYTLQSKESNGDLVASHFLNIRQLCCTIKKQLYVACRRFTFDPNSDTLWVNFCNAIKPTLELMKADQGIRDYKIVKEQIDKKATLKAKIRIIPIEAVEDFDLTVSLEDSFGETNAVVTE